MAQQRGMKRAEKVLKRTRKLKKREKSANLRRLERLLSAEEEAETLEKSKLAESQK